uniref:Uncharacterized protein n=1 Tax=Knipowitschia caucasica TaxID=637954 RepID=A0AAV2KTV7_KNICA
MLRSGSSSRAPTGGFCGGHPTRYSQALTLKHARTRTGSRGSRGSRGRGRCSHKRLSAPRFSADFKLHGPEQKRTPAEPPHDTGLCARRLHSLDTAMKPHRPMLQESSQDY